MMSKLSTISTKVYELSVTDFLGNTTHQEFLDVKDFDIAFRKAYWSNFTDKIEVKERYQKYEEICTIISAKRLAVSA